MEIYIEPHEVWSYFQENKESLFEDPQIIAEDINSDICLILTLSDYGTMPRILVFYSGNQVYGENLVSSADCEESIKRLLNQYFSDSDSEEEVEGVIEDRESELDNAVFDFLSDVVGDDEEEVYSSLLTQETINDCKEHFLEYIYRKHKISPYRPMYLECEDGTEEFFNRPYEMIDFDN